MRWQIKYRVSADESDFKTVQLHEYTAEWFGVSNFAEAMARKLYEHVRVRSALDDARKNKINTAVSRTKRSPQTFAPSVGLPVNTPTTLIDKSTVCPPNSPAKAWQVKLWHCMFS